MIFALMALCFAGFAQNAKAQDAKALFDQANVLKSKNDQEGRIKLLKQAIELDPKYDMAYTELAGAYWDIKDYAQSRPYAEKAVSINPKNELSWNLLGLLERNQKEYAKAIPYFEKVIEINPKASVTYANLAFCLEPVMDFRV